MISNGDLSNFGSISRCRRKVQEVNVELRGSKYDARHRLEDKVKDELRKWDSEQGDMFPDETKTSERYP